MASIKWTRSYDLRVDTRHFRVFVSKHGPASFHASCLWYEKGRMLKAPGQIGSFKFQLVQRHAATERDVVDAITKWIEQKFGTTYKLTPSAN